VAVGRGVVLVGTSDRGQITFECRRVAQRGSVPGDQRWPVRPLGTSRTSPARSSCLLSPNDDHQGATPGGAARSSPSRGRDDDCLKAHPQEPNVVAPCVLPVEDLRPLVCGCRANDAPLVTRFPGAGRSVRPVVARGCTGARKRWRTAVAPRDRCSSQLPFRASIRRLRSAPRDVASVRRHAPNLGPDLSVHDGGTPRHCFTDVRRGSRLERG
jgi:hypothetical protein